MRNDEKRMIMNNIWTSSDLGVSAALKALGFNFLGIQPGEGHRVIFVFEDTPEIAKEVQQYWLGGLRVDALAYFTAIKLLKSQIHSSRS